MKKILFFITLTAVLLSYADFLTAQDAAPAAATAPGADAPKYKDLAAFQESPGYTIFTANNIWMMLAAGLVFIMHLGFASLEAGLTQAKNTTNILFKNTLIPCIGLLTYALIGFNLMYPGGASEGKWFGFAGFGVSVTDDVASLTDVYNAGYTYWTDFLFQGMFAATAATIVSGAVAERIKLSSFLVFSTLFVAISYPITGMWKWGNGWLNKMDTPFYDFAGSTIVHSARRLGISLWPQQCLIDAGHCRVSTCAGLAGRGIRLARVVLDYCAARFTRFRTLVVVCARLSGRTCGRQRDGDRAN
jgi:hypothetical protein